MHRSAGWGDGDGDCDGDGGSGRDRLHLVLDGYFFLSFRHCRRCFCGYLGWFRLYSWFETLLLDRAGLNTGSGLAVVGVAYGYCRQDEWDSLP